MKQKITHASRESLAADLAGLAQASIKLLKEHWQILYGTKPPPRISRELLTRAVAYRLQEKVLGGLRPSTRRLLERLADECGARHPVRSVTVGKYGAGTVLIREWQGISHRVRVADRGVVYLGKRYGSLSEVARKITGAHWSGPLFFGLRMREKGTANGAR
jgi:Protein of unknown function (DUF2924)